MHCIHLRSASDLSHCFWQNPSLPKENSHLLHGFSDRKHFWHFRHVPRLLPVQRACFHSPEVKLSSSCATPHSQHDRRSTQSLQTRVLIAFACWCGPEKDCFPKKSPQFVHWNGVPSRTFPSTHVLQNGRLSFLLHCCGWRHSLYWTKLHPTHRLRGMYSSSIACQSMYSPRNCFNNNAGPFNGPRVNNARSKGR